MKIKLISDFFDWYDHAFYPDGDVCLFRNQWEGMSRPEMFRYLESLQNQVPQHGLVKDIVPTMLEMKRREMGMVEDEILHTDTNIELALEEAKRGQNLDTLAKEAQKVMFDMQTRVVVYTDPMKHRGEGKELLSGSEAMIKYPNHYCSVYHMSTMDGGSFSRRILAIGDLGFIIEYHSDDWRSNCGEVEIAVTHKFSSPRSPNIPFPMFAIDYIGASTMACDFNEAPGLDAIKDYVTATEIYEAVQKFMEFMDTQKVQ